MGRMLVSGPVVYYCPIHGWFGRWHFYQALARAMAKCGPVLYVSAPRRWPFHFSDASHRPPDSRLNQVESNLWIFEPVIPRGLGRVWKDGKDLLVARQVA